MAERKKHILVVDDNEYNRELLLQCLEDRGFSVDTASDGPEALESIDKTIPDMVLLDVMMPGLSGIEVCQRLRQSDRTRDLPVIMVTAKADSRDVVQGLHAGANDYVTKPIDMEVLLARMETHLSLKELQEEVNITSARLIRELAAARSVQESLLPSEERMAEMPESYGIEVGSLWRPSDTLGGDFWDLISLADGSLGILLIDFAGSGVVPSLNTFRIKTFVQGQCAGLYNAALTLSRINAYLISVLPDFEIATSMYVRYNPDKREFSVASAGLPYPLIYRAKTGAVERLLVSGLPVGAFPDASYRETVITLGMGDKIVFFTDGLFKYGSREKGLYSEKRLGELLVRQGAVSGEEFVQFLEQDILSYGPSDLYQDDVTAVVCEVVS